LCGLFYIFSNNANPQHLPHTRHQSQAGPRQKTTTVRFIRRTAEAIWEYLKDQIDNADSKQPLVLVEELSDPHAMNRHVLRRLLKRISDRAGIKNVHPHRFRHTFATEYSLLLSRHARMLLSGIQIRRRQGFWIPARSTRE